MNIPYGKFDSPRADAIMPFLKRKEVRSLDIRANSSAPIAWTGGDVVTIVLGNGLIELYDPNTGVHIKNLAPGTYDGFVDRIAYPDGRNPEWILIRFGEGWGDEAVWAGLPTEEWFILRQCQEYGLSIKRRDGADYE